MSNKITAYKIYSAGVILRGVKCLKGADKDSLVQLLFDIAAQVAEYEFPGDNKRTIYIPAEQ